MKKTHITIIALATLITPSVVFAASKNLNDLMILLAKYIQSGIYLIIALATITFIWGIWKYYFISDTDKKEALQYVLYGTIGFFVMLSFWGLVAILRNTFDLDDSQPNVPSVRFGSGLRSGNQNEININNQFTAPNFFDGSTNNSNSGANNSGSGLDFSNGGGSGLDFSNQGGSGLDISN